MEITINGKKENAEIPFWSIIKAVLLANLAIAIAYWTIIIAISFTIS